MRINQALEEDQRHTPVSKATTILSQGWLYDRGSLTEALAKLDEAHRRLLAKLNEASFPPVFMENLKAAALGVRSGVVRGSVPAGI